MRPHTIQGISHHIACFAGLSLLNLAIIPCTKHSDASRGHWMHRRPRPVHKTEDLSKASFEPSIKCCILAANLCCAKTSQILQMLTDRVSALLAKTERSPSTAITTRKNGHNTALVNFPREGRREEKIARGYFLVKVICCQMYHHINRASLTALPPAVLNIG